MDFKELIRSIPNFPETGICFRDITTLLKHGQAFNKAISLMAKILKDEKIDIVVAPEARGFIVGAPISYLLGAGFVPIRKPGKLPSEAVSYKYTLEYGQDSLEMHVDAIKPDQRVLLVDDLLSSGESILGIARELKRRKARRIFIAATFVLFAEGIDKFQSAYSEGIIDRVFGTNLTYQREELANEPWFVSVDMSEFIAYLIDRLNHDHSISALFDPSTKIEGILKKYQA
jgi:adenine phosphoribosyltransferase